MGFFNFKKKPKGTINSTVKVNDIYVVNSMIISSYEDGTGDGPYTVTIYFLAKCIDNEYYELFSGRKIEKDEDPLNGVSSQRFDTPYVISTEPLKKYLRDSNKDTIDIQYLFDFITLFNIEKRFS